MQDDIIKALAKYKQDNGLSYARMEKLLGIPEQQLMRWITGKHQPRLAWQELIRAKLGI